MQSSPSGDHELQRDLADIVHACGHQREPDARSRNSNASQNRRSSLTVGDDNELGLGVSSAASHAIDRCSRLKHNTVHDQSCIVHDEQSRVPDLGSRSRVQWRAVVSDHELSVRHTRVCPSTEQQRIRSSNWSSSLAELVLRQRCCLLKGHINRSTERLFGSECHWPVCKRQLSVRKYALSLSLSVCLSVCSCLSSSIASDQC